MYLVLEYMKRGDLVNVLKKRTEEERKLQGASLNVTGSDDITTQFSPLPDFDLWHIFRQIVSGVRYLHFQNIVHGDIKPQVNIISFETINFDLILF
jgi:serine/threonine protein kinase